jgi:putative ABC transport system substrate-binding protein
MTRRELLIVLGSGGLIAPIGSFVQQQRKVWRRGYLDYGSRESMMDAGRYAALIEGLRERGYIDGKDFVLEARYAEGNAERLNGLAAELVRQKVDILPLRRFL